MAIYKIKAFTVGEKIIKAEQGNLRLVYRAPRTGFYVGNFAGVHLEQVLIVCLPLQDKREQKNTNFLQEKRGELS